MFYKKLNGERMQENTEDFKTTIDDTIADNENNIIQEKPYEKRKEHKKKVTGKKLLSLVREKPSFKKYLRDQLIHKTLVLGLGFGTILGFNLYRHELEQNHEINAFNQPISQMVDLSTTAMPERAIVYNLSINQPEYQVFVNTLRNHALKLPEIENRDSIDKIITGLEQKTNVDDVVKSLRYMNDMLVGEIKSEKETTKLYYFIPGLIFLIGSCCSTKNMKKYDIFSKRAKEFDGLIKKNPNSQLLYEVLDEISEKYGIEIGDANQEGNVYHLLERCKNPKLNEAYKTFLQNGELPTSTSVLVNFIDHYQERLLVKEAEESQKVQGELLKKLETIV